MKQIKKLLALVLALAICAAFALPALADENDPPKYELTLNGAVPGHTYTIYQILKGDVAENTDEDTKDAIPFILSNVEIGNSGYTLESGDTMDDFLEYLSTMNADQLNKFISDNFNSFTTSYGGEANIKTVGDNETSTKWTGLEGGYYLVVDTTTDINEGDAASAVMVQVAGTTSITTKPTYPEVDKKIVDESGNKVNADDFAVGKKFDFEISTTVPTANLLAYANDTTGTYKLTLTDTMSEGLTFDSFKTYTINDLTSTELVMPTKDDNVTVNADGTTTIAVEISDLFDVIGKNKADWPVDDKENLVIKLVYSAYLNEKAVITTASGIGQNINQVKLNYRNKPNSDQYGDTDEKKVYVYTFALTGNKVDQDGEALSGAEFSLYKADGETLIQLYTVGGKIFAVTDGVEIPEETETFDKIAADGDNMDFTINGLPAGDYVLKEVKTPAGYNTIEPIEFTVSATYPTEETLDGADKPTTINPAGSKVTLTHTSSAEKNDDGTDKGPVEGVSTTIVNNKGSLLPSTGGIGTTIFYVVGAVLVVGAGVLLFTKRRIKN